MTVRWRRSASATWFIALAERGAAASPNPCCRDNWIARGLSVHEAIARIRRARPGAIEADEQRLVLDEFAKHLNADRDERHGCAAWVSVRSESMGDNSLGTVAPVALFLLLVWTVVDWSPSFLTLVIKITRKLARLP